MKILICIPDTGLAQTVFTYVAESVKETKLRWEVSNDSDCEKVKHQLSVDCFEYDIYFLDAMDRRCLEIARYVRLRNLIASIVFVAGDTGKIPNILLYRPSALITGMEDYRQVKSAVLWTYKEQVIARPYFTIKNKEEIIRVDYSDILWFESCQRTVILHSKKKEITFYAKLNEVYEKLPREMFLRCHQSYVVNCNMIRRIDKTQKCICLTNGKMIEISKSYYSAVVSLLC